MKQARALAVGTASRPRDVTLTLLGLIDDAMYEDAAGIVLQYTLVSM